MQFGNIPQKFGNKQKVFRSAELAVWQYPRSSEISKKSSGVPNLQFGKYPTEVLEISKKASGVPNLQFGNAFGYSEIRGHLPNCKFGTLFPIFDF